MPAVICSLLAGFAGGQWGRRLQCLAAKRAHCGTERQGQTSFCSPPLEVPLATVFSGSGESSASVRCDSVIVSDRKVGRIRGNSKTKVKAKHRKLRLKTSFHVNAEGSTPRHGSSFFPPSMSGSLSCNLYSAVGIYTLL